MRITAQNNCDEDDSLDEVEINVSKVFIKGKAYLTTIMELFTIA
jgi:hypothetical protein